MTRKTSPPAPPPTFEQIAERKLRERLTAYRELVARAAAGEQLPESDLEAAVELLAVLGLPDFAFRRDVQAQMEYDAASKAEAAARAQRPANDARLKEVVERLKTVEAEVAALKTERHRLGAMADHSLTAYMSRRHELESDHPHVLAPLEDALRFRLEQQRKRQGAALAGASR